MGGVDLIYASFGDFIALLPDSERWRPTKQPPYGQIKKVATDVAQEVARVCKTLTYQDSVSLAVAQKELPLALRLPTKEEVSQAEEVMIITGGVEMRPGARAQAAWRWRPGQRLSRDWRNCLRS